MKKGATAILIIVYFLASSGITIQTHYCMGQNAGKQFYATSVKNKCSKCGMMTKKKGCCHDDVKFAKLQDIHKNILYNFSFLNNFILIAYNYFQYNWQIPDNNIFTYTHNNSPPNNYSQSLCILNCVFRL